MEIDIRHGYQVECINCGRCLDAFRKVMTKRNEPGLIRYTFGLHGEGVKGLFNPRTLLPASAMLVMLVILSIAIIDRPVASLKVSVSHTAPSRQLANGQTGTFFNAWVNNRSQTSTLYTLQARNKTSGTALTLKGQIQTELPAGENRRLDFILITPTNESQTIEFVLINEEGVELSSAEAYIGKM